MRRGDPRAHRLGDRRGGFSRWRCRPRADGARPAATRSRSTRAARRGRLVRHARHGHARRGARPSNPTFRYRDLILITAFGVVLGTLVIQGLTLRPLLNRLRLEDDGRWSARCDSRASRRCARRWRRPQRARARRRGAREAPLRATTEARRTGARGRRREGQTGAAAVATGTADGTAKTNGVDADAAVVRAATDAQRKRLVAMRADGTIGDAAFQRIEEELDWAELDWSQLLQAGQPSSGERSTRAQPSRDARTPKPTTPPTNGGVFF